MLYDEYYNKYLKMDYEARKKECQQRVWEALISQNGMRYLWCLQKKEKLKRYRERQLAKEGKILGAQTSSANFSKQKKA